MSHGSGRRHHGAGPAASHAGIDCLDHLVEHLDEVVFPTTAIVCIGNDLCGDDGAGPAVAKQLAGAVPWTVYDVQTVPESFLMKIVNRRPESVVLVDALHFDAPPGAVDIIEAEKVAGQGPSTHGPAPLAFLEVLQMMHPCRRAVVGIQPEKVGVGDEMTAPVRGAVDFVARAFVALAEKRRRQGG